MRKNTPPCTNIHFYKITFMPNLFYLLIPSIFLLSCKPDHIWNEESNTVSREVNSMLKNYYKDINKDGLLAELKYLDSSAAFSWHPPGFDGPIQYDSVVGIIRDNALATSAIHLQWDSLEVIPVDAIKANYIGKIESILTDTSGHTDTFYLSEKGEVVKTKEGWKLRSGKTILLYN